MEELNSQIDDLQEKKLLEWSEDDTFDQELLNGLINNIQEQLNSEQDPEVREQTLEKLFLFLDTLPEYQEWVIRLRNINEFFDTIYPQNTTDDLLLVLKSSLYYSRSDKNTGYPIFAIPDEYNRDFNDEVSWMTKEEIYEYIMNMSGRGVDYNSIDSSQNTKAIKWIFAPFFEHSDHLKEFLIYWPKLYNDLQNRDVVNKIRDIWKKSIWELISMYWPEVTQKIIYINSFLKSNLKERKEFLLDKWKKLKVYWFDLPEAVLSYSNDRESNLIKNSIIQEIENLDISQSEKEKLLSVYWVFIREINENINNIVVYRDVLKVFKESLSKEINEDNFNVENFVSRVLWLVTNVVWKKFEILIFQK